MQKKHFVLVCITVALFSIAFIAYTLPESKPKIPVRILMKNSGGNLIFEHQKHHEQKQLPCTKCHHESSSNLLEAQVLACSACHPTHFGTQYIQNHSKLFVTKEHCIRCHHTDFSSLAYDHQEHIEIAGDDCQTCHHSSDIDPETTSCDQCHEQTNQGAMPSTADAVHTRCAQCHDDWFDKDTTHCKVCHKTQPSQSYMSSVIPCEQCHKNPKAQGELLFTRKDALHTQCMNCHQKQQQGPFEATDCNRCHIR